MVRFPSGYTGFETNQNCIFVNHDGFLHPRWVRLCVCVCACCLSVTPSYSVKTLFDLQLDSWVPGIGKLQDWPFTPRNTPRDANNCMKVIPGSSAHPSDEVGRPRDPCQRLRLLKNNTIPSEVLHFCAFSLLKTGQIKECRLLFPIFSHILPKLNVCFFPVFGWSAGDLNLAALVRRCAILLITI